MLRFCHIMGFLFFVGSAFRIGLSSEFTSFELTIIQITSLILIAVSIRGG